MLVRLPVCSFFRPLDKSFSQNWLVSFFQIIYMRLRDYICQIATEPIFVQSFGRKGPKIGYFPFLFFFEHFVICFSQKQWKMKILLIIDFPSRTSCMAKFLFWIYCPKCSWPVRLQGSLKFNIWKRK